MGVKNLWDILESCKQTLPLHHLQNKRLCVDLSCWLIQLQNASKNQGNPKDKIFLRSLFHRLRALIALNCSLIFVADGSIPSIKLSTYRRRLGLVSEVTREGTNSQPVSSLRRNMGSDFSCMIKEAKVLGLALGIPCLDGLEEAEPQCALLNTASLCDGCFSSDSDIFLFGAKTVYRDIILEVQNTRSDDQFSQVINAYLKPKCLSPDSEAVQRVCTHQPFIRTQLQQMCAQFFGWSSDKTDEYILPKIAERDLRRFANLRALSSGLGVRIPLDKMPVPCPVSAIVKQRKVQGKDYFEVAWQEMEGLKTSAVPVELVENACPEKIAEFIEMKCEGKKKQNRRQKKKSTKPDLGEVDLQLQGLLLDIESQSNSFIHTTTWSQPNSRQNVVEPKSFIDLSSPVLPLRSCSAPKHQATIDSHVDIIDIYESDSDVSPEHERKARELRLFISGIREDL